MFLSFMKLVCINKADDYDDHDDNDDDDVD